MRRGGARAYVAAVAVLALCCPDASAAPAREGIPASLTESRASEHFVVHYTTTDAPHAIPADSVPVVLAIAERAYAVEVNASTGFAPPLDDGDGRTDIYVHDLEDDVALTRGDRPSPESPNQASAFIDLDPGAAVAQGYQGALHYVLPHELFHVLQFSYSGREALWLAEATAEWAARSLAGVHFYARPEENWFRNPGESLDCFEESCGGTPTEERATQGYDRWPFFRHLEERFGTEIVHAIWTESRALSADGQPHALEAVDAALRAEGVSLADVFADFVAVAGAASWQLEALRSWLPAPAATIRTGRAEGGRSAMVEIAHLAASYVALIGGGRPESLSLCMPARLRVAVAQPQNQAESPMLVGTGEGGTHTVELAGDGEQRTHELRWETCQRATATLAVSNTSWLADGVPYRIATYALPRQRLRLGRRNPTVSFYLDLPAPRRVRTELTLPTRRGRPVRRRVRTVAVAEGLRPVSLRLPREGPNGRYRLAVRFRSGEALVRRARSFDVRFE